MDAIALSIFSSQISSVCEEMGAVLRHSAFSPNIKDRLDFSCAVFDSAGELCAQAAHIPVHLGSMAFAMADIIKRFEWRDGDMVILNDPFMGGTHLPDVTVVAPLFIANRLVGFVVNRAHHADIGSDSPGSMPISTRLDEEGLIIPPTYLLRDGTVVENCFAQITSRLTNPELGRGDFLAQISANRRGLERLHALVSARGLDAYLLGLEALNDHGERLARQSYKAIPGGCYPFEDFMEDDGSGAADIPIRVSVEFAGENIRVDFSGTAPQVRGNINCPLSVAAAAVFYVFRSLLPSHAPACAGIFRPIEIVAPEGCLVNAAPPAAVAAGNVETSTRIVDVIIGALAQALPDMMPAASHGSMNNIAMGSHREGQTWDYYETLGGGMGAGSRGEGASAIQTHMTNTLNTPIETLEMRFPLRVRRYQIRTDSAGDGRYRGGEGLIREFEFLECADVTLLTERRLRPPWGRQGGEPGGMGENLYNGKPIPGKTRQHVKAGDRITIKTPGGGGWGLKPMLKVLINTARFAAAR